MLIDRDVQLEILQAAAQHYPNSAGNLLKGLDLPVEKGLSNVAYLYEHGLLAVKYLAIHGHKVPHDVTITAKGIDFLSADGGLAQALAVVTVRLHEDSIRRIFEQKLDESSLPDNEKSELKEAIKSLPGEGLKHVITKFIDLGFENSAKAAELIQKAASLIS